MTSTTPSDAPTIELRASVLDAAINLGFRNSTMAKWMFDPLAEANDDEDATERSTPGLTSPSSLSTASPSASEESMMSPYNYRMPVQPTYEIPKLSMSNEPMRGAEYALSNNANRDRPGKLTLVVPPALERPHKLRKQKSGYDSDGGYISDSGKKTKKSSRWRKKDAGDDYESDGGYLSEAANTKKSKTKAKEKEKKGNGEVNTSEAASFLSTINASLLPEAPSAQADGYSTDGDAKRGRSKKVKDKKSPPGDDELSPNMPTKKKSLFRMMARSQSRDKDKDKERRPEVEAPPPVPPMPAVLPIAERFARSDTPLGSNDAASLTPLASLTKSASSMDLGSSEGTLVPPNEAERERAGSPWSFRSAPSRTGLWNNDYSLSDSSGATEFAQSLDIPRDVYSSMSMVSQPAEEEVQFASPQQEAASSPPRPTSPPEIDIVEPTKAQAQTQKKGRRFGFGSSKPPKGPSHSPPTISGPNPHLMQKELGRSVEAGSAPTSGGVSPTPWTVIVEPIVSPEKSPESFMFIEDDLQDPDPFSNYTSPSNFQTPTVLPPSTTGAGLAARRAKPALSPLARSDVTPTQSRSGSPTQEEAMGARASVLAYYQIPPPSPPPTGPLPAPPPPPSSLLAAEGDGYFPRRPSEDRQMLSPGRALGSRSPSPLRNQASSLTPDYGSGSRLTPSRSPSPGLSGPSVRRGKESPFPMRPVLPPQDSRELVERVERNRALYASENAEGEDEEVEEIDGVAEDDDAEPGSAYASSDEGIDTRSSMYIREARARGEKRVYFSPLAEEADDPSAQTSPAIRIESEEGGYFGAEGDESPDRRSMAETASVYSRYSVLDADKSAQVREGFVRRIAAMMGRSGEQWNDDIPDVPKIPAELAGRPDKGILKVSSPYKF